MTQTVPVAAAQESVWQRVLGALHLRPRPEPASISFADLVWAHHEWLEAHGRGEAIATAEGRYRKLRAAFEARHGPVFDEYWCLAEASAVALTIRPPSLLGRLLGVPSTVRLHRVTDWVTGETPRIADLLHRCDAVAIRVNEVLRGTSERIAIQWIYSERWVKVILGVADGAAGAHDTGTQPATAPRSAVRGSPYGRLCRRPRVAHEPTSSSTAQRYATMRVG